MRSRHIVCMLAMAAVLALFWAGCSQDTDTGVSPLIDQTTNATPAPEKGLGFFGAAIAVQSEYTPALMMSDDVVGTAVGLTDEGEPAVMILTKRALGNALPAELDGLPVVEASGRTLLPGAIAGIGLSWATAHIVHDDAVMLIVGLIGAVLSAPRRTDS